MVYIITAVLCVIALFAGVVGFAAQLASSLRKLPLFPQHHNDPFGLDVHMKNVKIRTKTLSM